MDKLHPTYVKIVPAGGNLATATPKVLADEEATAKLEEVLVEHKLSTNPNPKARHAIGTMAEMKFVLGEATETELATIMGGTVTNGVYTKLQGVRTLPNYDIEFGVYRPSDGLLCLYQYYDMNVIPSAEFSFKQGERYYLALTAKSTSISEYTIDNSAV